MRARPSRTRCGPFGAQHPAVAVRPARRPDQPERGHRPPSRRGGSGRPRDADQLRGRALQPEKLAARAGYTPGVQLLPDPDRPHLLADIVLEPGSTRTSRPCVSTRRSDGAAPTGAGSVRTRCPRGSCRPCGTTPNARGPGWSKPWTPTSRGLWRPDRGGRARPAAHAGMQRRRSPAGRLRPGHPGRTASRKTPTRSRSRRPRRTSRRGTSRAATGGGRRARRTGNGAGRADPAARLRRRWSGRLAEHRAGTATSAPESCGTRPGSGLPHPGPRSAGVARVHPGSLVAAPTRRCCCASASLRARSWERSAARSRT